MFEALERLTSADSSVCSCIKGNVRIFGLREAQCFAECILEGMVRCELLHGFLLSTACLFLLLDIPSGLPTARRI